MSQPMGSTDNEHLLKKDRAREKQQSEFGYSSGAEQMSVEERERQRILHSNALADAGDPRLTEERIFPEGMGGAGGGNVDDVGDVGFPEEAGGGPVSVQQRAQGLAEGMGGAGGGDIDDIGDVGYPDDAGASALPTRVRLAGDVDERFDQAWQLASDSTEADEDMRAELASAENR